MNGAEYAELKRESRRTTGTYKDEAGNVVPTGTTDAYADSKLFEAIELDGIAKNRTTDYQDMMIRQRFPAESFAGCSGRK